MNRSLIAPLLEPMKIRGVELPNRVIMSPMTRSASPGGVPGADVAAYYRKRADGGVGTIFTEAVCIEHPGAIGDFGMGDGRNPYMWGEAALAGWRRVVHEVHAAGSLIFPQLMHLGVMKRPGSGGEYPSAWRSPEPYSARRQSLRACLPPVCLMRPSSLT